MKSARRPEIADFKLKMAPRNRATAAIATICIAAAFIGANFAWLRLDRTPPSWDDGYYLTKSLDLYDALTERGIAGYASRFLRAMDRKPPLIAVLPTPLYLAAGRRYRAAYAINLLFLAITFAAVYGIANRYAGSRAGFLAVFATGTMPILYGLSHWYLVECGLIALVCATIHLLTGWNESSGAGRALALGAVCAFGLLMKASFPVYVLVPFVYFLFLGEKKTPLRRKSIVAFAGITLLIAAPWYLVNFRGMLATAVRAGSADTAKTYGTGDLFSISAILHYFSDLANAAPALYLLAIPLFVLAAGSLPAPVKRGVLLAALWLSPVVLLAAGHYREIRYAAALYPACALIFGFLGDAAIRRHRVISTVAVGAILLAGLCSMIQNAFPVFGKPWELGGLLLVEPRLDYARPFHRAAWPQQEILADIYGLSKWSGGKRRLVLVGTDSVRFNADNFALAAAQRKLPFEIATTAYTARAEAAIQAANAASYFVYSEGGAHDQPSFNLAGDAVAREIRENGRFRELPISRTLPDGGLARVFERVAADPPAPSSAFLSAGLDDIPDCKVTFADSLQLAGIKVSRTPRGLEVKYRWRCLKRLDRDYWCFTHVVANGQVIGNLDHPLPDGSPPASRWNPGNSGLERFVFPLANERSVRYELRIGIYHPASRERLAIVESTLPLIQENTAAVIAVTESR